MIVWQHLLIANTVQIIFYRVSGRLNFTKSLFPNQYIHVRQCDEWGYE